MASCHGTNPYTAARNVGGLFPPQSQQLNISHQDIYSPAILEKITYSGAHAHSFARASEDLRVLAEVEVSSKQVERVDHRIGGELIDQANQKVAEFEALPLVEKEKSPIPNPPSLAVLEVDGGRFQLRTDNLKIYALPPGKTAEGDQAPRKAAPEATRFPQSKNWREDKFAVLLTMDSAVHKDDPNPEIPEFFWDRPMVEKLAKEIGHVPLEPWPTNASMPNAPLPATRAAPGDPAVGSAPENPAKPKADEYQAPTVLVRTYVATAEKIRAFETMVAQAVWARGFYGAERKAFVSDGAPYNWSIWQACFPRATPILDFIHALTYVFSAATHQLLPANSWSTYCRWIQAIWSGRVVEVLAEMRSQLTSTDLSQVDPKQLEAFRSALTYLENNQTRMRYDQYRQQGLPINSCHIESTIKQFNQRVKGTEKYWSRDGIEAQLAIKAAYLDETGTMDNFWKQRHGAKMHSTAQAVTA